MGPRSKPLLSVPFQFVIVMLEYPTPSPAAVDSSAQEVSMSREYALPWPISKN